MIEEILIPVDITQLQLPELFQANQIGSRIQIMDGTLPDAATTPVALIGINEYSNGINMANAVRQQLYQLYADVPLGIADMGNMEPGSNMSDTLVGLTEIITELLAVGVVPIILAEHQAYTYAQFKAYTKRESFVNLASIDSYIDFGAEETLDDKNYLRAILTHEPNYVFNFSHLGHQTYLTDPELLKVLNDMHFECMRLGDIQEDIRNAEPLLRNADLLTMDMDVIRSSDHSAHTSGNPHGLYGEQACALARYAGISDTVSSFGLYNYQPRLDTRHRSAQLAAHLIWHFMQGFYYRKPDHPAQNPKNYIKYLVSLKDHDYEITFWKHKLTDRWWYELPQITENIFHKMRFVPCSYNEYLTACQDEIPERWLKGIERLY